MPSDRNALRGGMSSLLKRQSAAGGDDSVTLVNKAGRPTKDNPSNWGKARDCRTTIVMDREQNNLIKKIANKTGVTFKQAMFLLLEEGLSAYNSGKLVIEGPRDEA